jgi:hypothetical protein
MPNSTPNSSRKLSAVAKLSAWQRFKLRPFVIRYSHWEFLPAWIANVPHVLIFIYYAIRARSLFWFSATNPTIYTGGMIGESKDEIHQLTPNEYMPTTITVKNGMTYEQILTEIETLKLSFPLIVKPDRGGRGIGVQKIHKLSDLEIYHRRFEGLIYHVQELIDLPVEAGVMFYRYPDGSKQGILSVTLKGFLTMEGDGVSTLRELVDSNFRAVLVREDLEKKHSEIWNKVIAAGKKLELEPIGNHCKGTAFISAQELICEEMVAGFAKISEQINGFYFGRYDVRCPSLEDLKAGRYIKILEINGVGADPAHIYDSRISIIQKYKTVAQQWKIMFEIACYNHKINKIAYMSLADWRKHNKETDNFHKKHGLK